MRRGFALLWVVILLAFLVIIATGLFFAVNTEQMISKSYKSKELSFWAAEGGREWGKTCFKAKYPHPEADWFPPPIFLPSGFYTLYSVELKGWKTVGSIDVPPSYELIFERTALVVKDNGQESDVDVYQDRDSREAGVYVSIFPLSFYFYLKFDLVIFSTGKFGKSNTVVKAVYGVEYRYTIF